ncbi:probable indole-3-pyruvate monooxygenase YUCCA10 [Syzygium oleosum]|uniref:probable indole-3-pyruvate monooxygenase YUCCA10 n=1 Tax=Syzygium oleosum TaxID=219896 RepID=UPI0024B925C0|nr:probable indole-3-pyruvate monooxygenase YUCCA10 [Syzygium oleosum]
MSPLTNITIAKLSHPLSIISPKPQRQKMIEQEAVAAAVVVGAGPSGLAMSACLKTLSIPHVLLEREDCFASLWKKYAYDRLHLHLRKRFCELPHMHFPPDYPEYVPKAQFLRYLDDYAARFGIEPAYGRSVESAAYDEGDGKWRVNARVADSGEVEEYRCRFLVVATGETSDAFVPEVEGIEGFGGKVIHSTGYKNGKEFENSRVLVVGSGNSGMEIALDLANHGARTSVVVRSPVHVLPKGAANLGLVLLKYLSLPMVDSLLVLLSKLVYGDMSKYGLRRPSEGPFLMKVKYGKYPFIDVGTCQKIKSGEIQLLPALKRVEGNVVEFEGGKSHPFDAVVFCTGFKRSTHKWLKAHDYLLNEDGIPKPSSPNHWKGEKGLYCVGLSRRGFYGAASDAQNVADDIKAQL